MSAAWGVFAEKFCIRRVAMLLQALQWSSIDALSHTVKVNQQTKKDLVCGRAVFMYATQVAQN